VAPTETDRVLDDATYTALRDTTTNSDATQATEMPTQGVVPETGALKLSDLVGKDYDDPAWEKLLNEVSVSDMEGMFDNAAFKTAGILSISKPLTNDTDGPAGFINFMDTKTFYGTAFYACECTIAATWDLDLVKAMGVAVGNEGLIGQEGGLPYSGWYAPGVNIHRSPFGGRTGEYYSEDGFLNGMMAASLIQGCRSKGVYNDVKHFALNEQETHRAVNGDITWATEQSIREIYLKPFEKASKLGKATGIMSSFNRIGTRWTGGDYRLLTKVLRNEWGFRGLVICDFNTNPSYQNSKQMAYAGGDLNLATQPVSWVDASNAADVAVLRSNCHNVLYTVANSNALNSSIIGYKKPIWVVITYIVDATICVGLVAWGFFAVRSAYKKDAAKKASASEQAGDAGGKKA
jgi:beta-glucosidase